MFNSHPFHVFYPGVLRLGSCLACRATRAMKTDICMEAHEPANPLWRSSNSQKPSASFEARHECANYSSLQKASSMLHTWVHAHVAHTLYLPTRKSRSQQYQMHVLGNHAALSLSAIRHLALIAVSSSEGTPQAFWND